MNNDFLYKKNHFRPVFLLFVSDFAFISCIFHVFPLHIFQKSHFRSLVISKDSVRSLALLMQSPTFTAFLFLPEEKLNDNSIVYI